MNSGFYKKFFHNVNQPLLVLNSSTGKVVDLNSYAEKLDAKKGMTVFEIFDRYSRSFLPEDIQGVFEKIDGKICAMGENVFKWKIFTMQKFTVLLGAQADEGVDFYKKADELEQKFNSVFNNSLIGYLIMSVTGEILEANKAFCNMLGYSHVELIGKKFTNIVHESDREAEIEIHKMMGKGHLLFVQNERRIVHKTGIDVWSILNTHAVYNDNNEPVSLISTIIDVTDKKAYDAHIQSVAHFTDENPFPVMRVTKEGEILYFNKAVYAMVEQFGGGSANLSSVPDNIKEMVAESIKSQHSIEREIEVQNRIFDLFVTPVQGKEYADVFARDITEIRKGEDIVRLSEERFRAIFNSSYRFVGLLDTHGKIIEINRAALDFSGAKHRDVVGKNFWETSEWRGEPSKRETIKQSIEYAAKGNFVKYEVDIIGKNDNIATIIFSIKPVRDSNGNVILLIPEGSDITDLKKTKKELESYKVALEELVEVRTKELTKRENFLATIFRNIPYIITIKDAQSKNFISINKQGMKMFGINHLDTGKRLIYDEDIFNFEDAKINKEQDEEVISKGVELEIAEDFIETIYGQKVFRTKKIPVMFENKIKYVMSISEDITYTRKAQQKLKILSEAIEHNPAAVIITNNQGVIEYVNPKHTELTGYSYTDSIGKTPAMLNSGYHDSLYYENMWETIKSGKIWRGEILNKNKNGDVYWEKASISPIHNNNGEISAFVAVKEDITEMRIAAEQLKKAKEDAETANKAKSAFIANMSHEIRTPMNAVLGFAQILKRDSLLTNEQRQSVDIIFKSGEHLLGLINDVLEMSKIEAGKVSVSANKVDVLKIIDDVETIFRKRIESKDILFIVEKDLKNVRYIAKTDESKIRQLLINFLGNSAKFTSRGHIKLSVKTADSTDNKREIRFDVIDTGIGIKKEEYGKLFKSFEQTESGKNTEGGTGLGLAICKQYADMLGAKIEFESEYLVGSVFSFIISTEVEELCEVFDAGGGVLKSPKPELLCGNERQEEAEKELPSELKQNIREAVFQGYTEKIKCHINEVLSYDQKMYEKLNKLFVNYDYDGILSILEKKVIKEEKSGVWKTN